MLAGIALDGKQLRVAQSRLPAGPRFCICGSSGRTRYRPAIIPDAENPPSTVST